MRILALLLLAMLCACMNIEPYVPVPAPPVPTQQCFDGPEAQRQFESMIEQHFQIEPGTYEVISSECELGRGGNLSAVLRLEGQEVTLRYDWGWCSSGGSDCGWSSCIIAPQGELYDRLKAAQCSMVSETQVSAAESGGICTHNDSHDGTDAARQECLGYGQAAGGQAMFSVLQEANRCGSSAQPGPIPC